MCVFSCKGKKSIKSFNALELFLLRSGSFHIFFFILTWLCSPREALFFSLFCSLNELILLWYTILTVVLGFGRSVGAHTCKNVLSLSVHRWGDGRVVFMAQVPPGSLQSACVARGWRWALQTTCLNSSIQQARFTLLAWASQLPEKEVNMALRMKGFCGWKSCKPSCLITCFLMRTLRLLRGLGNLGARTVIRTRVSILPVYTISHKTRLKESPSSVCLWLWWWFLPLPVWERQMEILQMSHSVGFPFSKCLQWMKLDMSIWYHIDQQMTWCTRHSAMRKALLPKVRKWKCLHFIANYTSVISTNGNVTFFFLRIEYISKI